MLSKLFFYFVFLYFALHASRCRSVFTSGGDNEQINVKNWVKRRTRIQNRRACAYAAISFWTRAHPTCLHCTFNRSINSVNVYIYTHILVYVYEIFFTVPPPAARRRLQWKFDVTQPASSQQFSQCILILIFTFEFIMDMHVCMYACTDATCEGVTRS